MTGMAVPGIRSPRLPGDASATAGSRSRSTSAERSNATAREAALYPSTTFPASRGRRASVQPAGPGTHAALETTHNLGVGDAGAASRPPAAPRSSRRACRWRRHRHARRAAPRAAPCRRRGSNSHAVTRAEAGIRRASRSARWWSSRRSARGAARSTGPDGQSRRASGTAAAAPRPAPAAPRARPARRAWSAACIRPKQSRTTSACAAAVDRRSGRGRRAGPARNRHAGCRTRRPARPAGSRPAAATRATASAACATSAAGSAPLGSSGTVGSVEQLRQPALRAEPHLQRVNRIGPWIVVLREVVARGLLAKIEHKIAGRAAAGPALVVAHSRLRPDGYERGQLPVATSISAASLYTATVTRMLYQIIASVHVIVDQLMWGEHVSTTYVPPVRRGPYAHFRRPWDVSALRELSRGGAAGRARGVLSAARAAVRDCLLVQLPAYVSGEDIFSDYAYFSSYSDSWVAHAKRYADEMIDRLGLTADSLVTEVASNDGYLLQHFHAAGIPVLGIEPAANVAEAARAKGIRTVVRVPRPGDRAPRSPPSTAGPTWSPPTTCSRTCPTSAASRPGCARWSRTRGW